MPAPVRIRIGAGLDASVEQAFGDYEKRAAKAAENAQRALNKRGRTPKDRTAQGSAAKAGADEEIQQARRSATVREKINKDSSRAALAEIRRQSRARAREHRELLQETQREERKAARERERQERAEARRRVVIERNARRDLDRFATRTSHRATRFLAPNMPIASVARRGAMDLARGYGFETGLSGALGRGIEMQARATTLSEAAYMPGAEGAAAKKVDPQTILKEVRQVGDELMMPYEDALGALEAFVTKTGDLETGRRMLMDMAALSGATGTNLSDMVDAAGDVANALGDIPNKGKAIDLVMRQFVVQGKVGAVEIKDLAKYMAILSASTGAFGGESEDTIVKLGALAQLSRAKGGAASAAQATRSVAGLANTLQTPARRAKFKEYGIQLEDKKGLLRDPIEILKESIRKTKGDTEKVKSMWSNVIGAKPAQALSAAYKGAGGGAAGEKAMEALLAPYLGGGAMSKEQIKGANVARMQTDAAKVQQFNNELQKVADQIRSDLAPTLAELTPKVLELVRGFGNLVQWLLTNPGLAITGAITASIARAGLESTLRSGIESAIKGVATNKSISITGKLAAGATIAATAVTIAIAGMGAIDWAFGKAEEAQSKAEVGKAIQQTEFSTAERLQREKGGITQERKENLQKIVEEQRRRVAAAQEFGAGRPEIGGKKLYAPHILEAGAAYAGGYKNLYALGKGVLGLEGGKGVEQIERERYDAANLEAMKAELAQMNAKLQNLRVYVTNADEIRPSKEGGVDPTGRE